MSHKNPRLGNTGMEFKQRAAREMLIQAIDLSGGNVDATDALIDKGFYFAKINWEKMHNRIMPAKDWPALRHTATLELARILASGELRNNPVSPEQVRELRQTTALPDAPEFAEAVANTPGARLTPEGLLLSVERWQKWEQAGARSVRSAVFYLPEKSASAKHYRGGKTGYGGEAHIRGETLLQRPLFVRGATGGKVPEMAYAAVAGKKALAAVDKAIFDMLNQSLGRRAAFLYPLAANILRDFGADEDLAYELVEYSQQGNQLRYAMRELIICSAVREAGYDSILGWSKGKKGPFISEIIDLREDEYPSTGNHGSVHPHYARSNPGPLHATTDTKTAEAQAIRLFIEAGLRLGRRSHVTFVEQDASGQVLGAVAHSVWPEAEDHEAHVMFDIVVGPNARGRSVGSQLVDAAIAWWRSQRAAFKREFGKPAVLVVHAINPRITRMLERRGAKVVMTTTDGTDILRMEK